MSFSCPFLNKTRKRFSNWAIRTPAIAVFLNVSAYTHSRNGGAPAVIDIPCSCTIVRQTQSQSRERMRRHQDRFSRFGITLVMGFLIWNLTTFSQAPAPTPIRIGDVARHLSDSDVADLDRALPAGSKKPWLLVGVPGQYRTIQIIEAYMPPDSASRELRRGSVLRFGRRVVDRAKPEAWALVPGVPQTASSRSYAQVTVAGRNFEQIKGEQDPNRPFLIEGSFDDAELISLIAFIRSSRVAAGTIESVYWQSNDSIRVENRQSDLSWQVLTIQRKGQEWVIVGNHEAIA